MQLGIELGHFLQPNVVLLRDSVHVLLDALKFLLTGCDQLQPGLHLRHGVGGLNERACQVHGLVDGKEADQSVAGLAGDILDAVQRSAYHPLGLLHLRAELCRVSRNADQHFTDNSTHDSALLLACTLNKHSV